MINVKAETATFYEAEFINNIYMDRYQYTTHTVYYQQARFYRKVGSNDFVYCVEPFSLLLENTPYEAVDSLPNLTEEQIEEITKIAYFGYGYKNHTHPKWYAVTQALIWEAADKTGDYYFTDTLNGRKVNDYAYELDSLQQLVNSYDITPSFSNQSFDIVENQAFIIEDTNHALSDFNIDYQGVTINNNTLQIEGLEEGVHTITFTKGSNENIPTIFYYSPTSQDMVEIGSLPKIEVSIQINVQKTSLEITKIDKDTQSTTPSGEASLEGTTYELYDNNKNKLQEMVVENNQIILENMNYGTYYLKETQAGEGYILDDKTYEISISKESPNKNLILENEVIKKKILLEKKYGNNNFLSEEQGISFSITNNKGEEITTIITNEEGKAEITLPYGTYTITQLNTTKGYEKTNPVTIQVKNTEEEIIELRDWEIPVPNTYKEKNSFSILLLILWLFIQ